MVPRLLAVLRLLRRIATVVALLLVTALVAATLTIYLAITTPHMGLLRTALGHLGGLVAGQKTQSLTADVRVLPKAGELAGRTTLRLQNDTERSRFYFLFNPGLRVRQASALDSHGQPLAMQVYQLALFLVAVPLQPLAANTTFDLTIEYHGKPWLDVLGGANLLSEGNVLLNVDAFWYPVDAQSFFDTDITVRLPRSMTLVHNTTHAVHTRIGDEQIVHWRSTRPVAGVALVAGTYRLHEQSSGGITYRLLLADDVELDSTALLESMAHADRALSERFGGSGFDTVTIFVSRKFRRGFNDGSGLIGLSLRYFRTGDNGYALIAHEIAHNWWGATVSGSWLSAGGGAQWMVEGFAEFGSLIASEARFGENAVNQRLLGEMYDPDRQGAVAAMSVLDNALDEARARDTIYRKGAYVLWMLRHRIGDEVVFRAIRELATRFRYRHAGEVDVQRVLEEVSGTNLDEFFTDWVRGEALLDISLDPIDTGRLQINNLGKAMLPGALDVWTVPDGDGEITRSSAELGAILAVPPDATVIVDPLLTWADVRRENNRFPRREDALAVAVAVAGRVVAVGEPFPWGRTAIVHTSRDGQPLHTWELNRGLLQPPVFAANGQWLVASVADRDSLVPNIVTLHTDNPQKTIGKGHAPAPTGVDTVYAAHDDRIVRFENGVLSGTVVQHSGAVLDLPLPSSDGKRLAYVVGRRNDIDLRLIDSDGSHDRSLLTWDRDRMVLHWSSEHTLHVLIGGDADWQIWEVDSASGNVSTLVRDAAAIGDMALSGDGTRLAFTAAADSNYPRTHRQLFVLDLRSRTVQSLDVANADLARLVWEDDSNILAVGIEQRQGRPSLYPQARRLHRIEPASAQVSEVRHSTID